MKTRVGASLLAAAVIVALLGGFGLGTVSSQQGWTTSGVPAMVAYRGQVPGPDSDYTGDGLFKFVLVDGKGQSVWASDGRDTPDGREPETSVQVQVVQGQYSVLLGDKRLPGMAGDLDARDFSYGTELWLRVWFSKNGDKFYQSEQDEPIGSVPYAMHAQVAAFADTVDGVHAEGLQARVSGDCTDYGAIRAINPDGSVECTGIVGVSAVAPPISLSITSLDPTGGAGGPIAIGGDGLPVIVGIIADPDRGITEMRVLHCGNLACSSGNTVAAIEGPFFNPGYMGTSLARGTDGLPVVAFTAEPQNRGDHALYVLHCGNADCTSGNVITQLDISEAYQTGVTGPDIAIGADGLPLVGYLLFAWGSSLSTLKVVHCGNAACSAGNTISTLWRNDRMYATSLAIGSGGLPLIGYVALDGPRGTGRLEVIRCLDDHCNGRALPVVLDRSVAVGVKWTQVAVGSDNLPVFSYYDQTNGALRVAHCGNAACTGGNATLIVDNTGDVGEANSMAIGMDGMPVIAYWDKDNRSLKVAHCGDPACSTGNTTRTIDPGPNVGEVSHIRIGPDGLPVIVYWDRTNDVMKVVHCTNASCWAPGVP